MNSSLPSTPSLSLSDIRQAARRLEGKTKPTPVLTSDTINNLAGAEVFLKAENLQVTGSFKFRGATNAIAQLSPQEAAAGVITYSSGNHAQGLARAGREAGVDVVVVMPHDAPANKVAATQADGAQLVRYDRYQQDRAQIAAKIVQRAGQTLIPPYDHRDVMAGQGTAALEFLTETPQLDTLVVPVGGGGLLAGSATTAKGLNPEITVIGVEPQAGDDHRQSRQAGRTVSIEVPHTIADGQQVTSPGVLTWPITDRLTDDFTVVSDEEIIQAMVLLRSAFDLLVEPSGASALAAVLNHRVRTGQRIGVVVSGGNITPDRFAELCG